MSASLSDIALILPPRERFRAVDAGAVALTVKDFIEASSLRERITVLGGEPEHFPQIHYRHVPARLSWLLGRNISYAISCMSLLKKSQARVIEVHNRVLLALRLKSRFADRHVTLHVHNDPWGMDGARTPAQRRRLLLALDAVYCVSEYVRSRLLEGVEGVDASHVHVIYNGLHFEAMPSAPKQPFVTYAGRFIPEKGVLELAQALAEVLPRFPDWRAVFLGAWGFGHEAGRSSYEQSVYAALKRVEGQVEFKGHVPHQQVMQTFAEASIALAPSTGVDAFNRSAVEAMAQGCAVVVSTMGGLSEIAGEAAMKIKPVTPEGLAQALTRLLGDDAYRESVATACRLRARSTFSIASQVQKLDAARLDLLRER